VTPEPVPDRFAKLNPNEFALTVYVFAEAFRARESSIGRQWPLESLKLIGTWDTRSVSEPSALSYQVSLVFVRL
jgi:hypothetical protein